MSIENPSGIEISEKKLEDFIYDHLCGNIDLELAPFDQSEGCVYRQFNIGSSYGIIDIISFSFDYDGDLYINIYELKKGSINKDSLVQILRYKSGIHHILNKFDIRIQAISCHLIGGYLSEENGFSVAVSAIEDLCVYIYSLDPVSGLEFKECSFVFKNIEIPKRETNVFTCIDIESKDRQCSFIQYEKGI